MKKTGDRIFAKKQEFILGKCLGSGYEGQVFEVIDQPRIVAKIIQTDKKSNDEINFIRKHLIWLRDVASKDENISGRFAFPKVLLDDELGYLMWKVEDHVQLSNFILHPNNVKEFESWYLNDFSLKKRLDILIFLFNSLTAIHKSGLVFTDLSPNNILVHRKYNSVVYIDTDNIRRQSDQFHSVLGTPGYIAPEVHYTYDEKTKQHIDNLGINLDFLPTAMNLSVDSDVFSAAVIAFQLLTLQHPFVGDKIENGSAKQEEIALKCLESYVLDTSSSNFSTNPLLKLFIDDITASPTLKMLFWKTFVIGKYSPKLRPTAQEFSDALMEDYDKLTKCEKCGHWQLYVTNSLNVCGMCDSPIPERVQFKIFDQLSNNNTNDILSSILKEKVEFECKELKHLINATIILDEGVDKKLYLFHLGRTNRKDKLYATIRLTNKQTGDAIIQISDINLLQNCQIMDRQTMKARYIIKQDKIDVDFNIFGDVLIFEIVDSIIGKITTFGLSKRKN
jgi:eukaryotic-like serine/threonine-protein kinase